MRLLLVGNSHCAAVMAAHAEAPGRWPGLELQVIALPGDALRNLRLGRGRFRSPHARTRARLLRLYGTEQPPFDPPDAVAVLAGNPIARPAVLTLRHRSADLPSGAALARGEAPGREDVQLLSRPALALALRGLAETSTLAAGLRLVAPLGVPVALMPAPLPPVARLDGGAGDPVADAARRGDGAALLALARTARIAALRQIAARTGADARPLDQPAGTVTRDIFTAARWTEGSVHLFARKPGIPDDPLDDHANADYGALVLDSLLDALGCSAPPGIGVPPRL